MRTEKDAARWEPSVIDQVSYDPPQERLYKARERTCIYPLFPRWKGTLKAGGNFPVVVAREHYRKLGYTVLIGEPELPDSEGFILLHFSGKRKKRHPAYMRMAEIFGLELLDALNREADVLKLKKTKGRGGGDPDLFVYKSDGKNERFFVEVKHRDCLTPKQLVTFPLIEARLCQVRVAQLIPLHRRQDSRQRQGSE